MNRNVLKIIAVVTMLVDHIGWQFFPDIVWLRVIGRLAFPIFAFFISEGMRYTRDRKRYILTMLLIGVISQVFYSFLAERVTNLNIMFTFVFAGVLIVLIEKVQKENKKMDVLMLTLFIVFVLLVWCLTMVSYGILGVVLVLAFYFIRNKPLKYTIGALILIFMSLFEAIIGGFTCRSIIQVFSVLSVVIIALCYNGQKGKINLKYLFYVFYPLHLAVILLIKILI